MANGKQLHLLSMIRCPVAVAIIGTAGRNPNNVLTPELFSKMSARVLRIMEESGITHDRITLVSGGAAWADHVAVDLWNMGSFHSCKLHFPAAWITGQGYEDTKSNDWRRNPGRSANQYHMSFSKAMGRSTLCVSIIFANCMQ